MKLWSELNCFIRFKQAASGLLWPLSDNITLNPCVFCLKGFGLDCIAATPRYEN